MPIDKFPRPENDNGWGMHWVPTVRSTPEVVDKFVGEAKDMGVKWMVFLNEGARIDPANDYLVKKLTEAGIEPVMRLYSPTLQPLGGDIEAMVRHYKGLGVDYFQPFNEPNLKMEQPDGPHLSRSLSRHLATRREGHHEGWRSPRLRLARPRWRCQ